MKKILITGGKNGHIGSYLREHLGKLGHEVLITSRKPDMGNCRYMDLLDEKSIQGVCEDIDIVIHTASMDERLIPKDGRSALLINAYATRQLYLDAIESGVERFIYLSTFHVYGASAGNITEDSPANPKSDYALTHYFAELYLKQLCGAHNPQVVIARLTNGIGPPPENIDRWYLALNDLCKSAYENGIIRLNTNGVQRRDFVAIKDVCSAIAVLMSLGSANHYDLFNISQEKTHSIKELAYLAAEVCAIRKGTAPEICIPDFPKNDPAEDSNLFIGSSKLRQLGWSPKTSVIDVIHDIYKSLEG